MTMAPDEYDFIIAGGGTAGCIIARRLIQRTDARVLLLEAGPSYPPFLLDVPLLSTRLGYLLFSWRHQTTPQPGLGGRSVILPMGKVVGGSSSIHAMISVVGFDRDLDAWAAAAGTTGWSADELAAYIERAFDGPEASLGLQAPRYHSAFSEAFLEACEQNGLRRQEPLSSSVAGTCGYFPMLQKDGKRYSVTRGYIDDLAKHSRLTIRTGAHVRRVLIEDGRAVGVEFTWRRRRRISRSRREVIVSLGAFGTPQILMCSGVGAADHLQACGIPVHCDLPGVGRGLSDHLRAPVLYRSGRTSPASLRRLPAAIARFLLHADGLMTSNCCESGAFLSSQGGAVDLQLITHFQSVHDARAVDLECSLVRSHSRGTVELNQADPFGPTRIDPQYLSDERDTETMIDGILQIRDIAAEPALRKFPLYEETLPGTAIRSRAELGHYLRQHATTAYHPAGTCRMGTDEHAVVDHELRTRGIEGLRIADASIMPTLPAGNTCCPVIMIAEKAADLIIADP